MASKAQRIGVDGVTKSNESIAPIGWGDDFSNRRVY